jgi:pilus assembly protein CpaF
MTPTRHGRQPTAADVYQRDSLGPAREEIVTRLSVRLSDVLAAEAARREDQDGPRRRSSMTLDRDLQRSMVGGWIQEEIATIGQRRLASGERPLGDAEINELRRQVLAQMFGHGPLEPWMHDDTVEEIDVNSHLSTWLTFTDGRKQDVGQLWESAEALTAYQKGLVLRMGTAGESRLDTSSPMVTLQADDGSRVVLVLGGRSEHGVSTHPRIAIRRFTVRQVGLAGLADLGLFPHWLIPQLTALVRTGFTILVSGGPGAGKTTLLTELLGVVSPMERIVTVEKSLLELRLEDDPRHPDAPALFTRQANSEQRGEVTTRSLVELTRRLNPDRVVVGELVEDEALDMLDVASMCKRGSMATIHAHTSDVVLHRLAYYVAKSQTTLPEFAVWSLISQTVDFVIHIDLVRNASDGEMPSRRRVTSIVEVGGQGERGGVASSEVWGLDDSGEFRQFLPLMPRHLRQLALSGYRAEIFAPRAEVWAR